MGGKGEYGRKCEQNINVGNFLREVRFFFLLLFLLGVMLSVPGLTLADVIIDNGEPGTSYTGSWSISGGTSPYGDDSLWSRDGATYTWQFSNQPEGMYRVHAWWSGWPSRSNSVQARINYTGGQASATLDQSVNTGLWNNLGTFYFGGSGSVTITAAEGSSVSTAADAIWFELVSSNTPPIATIESITPNPADPGAIISFSGSGVDSEGPIVAYEWISSIIGAFGTMDSFASSSLGEGVHTITLRVQDADGVWSDSVSETLVVGTPPEEIIIDNRDPETSQTGSWDVSGASEFYGADSVWSRDGTTFSWNFNPPKSGEYQVSIRCTEWPSRSTSVPVFIAYEGGNHTEIINQQVGGGEWKDIGQYPFDINNGGTVMVTSQPGPSSTCADAVKFQFAPTNDLPVAIIGGVTPTGPALGEMITFTGHGTDTDGEVVAYSWSSNVMGDLSDQASFSSSVLVEALHVITFKVQDDGGAWSEPETIELQVGNPPNQLPTATIGSIAPSPANIGQAVAFVGSGEDLDGDIVGYRWESDLDNLLSESSAFSTNSLSEGTHTISFQVVDDQGAASLKVERQLTVQNPPPETIIDNVSSRTSSTGNWDQSSAPDFYGSGSLWARDGATFTWTFTPSASGSYEAFMWHTEWPSRSTSAPVMIETAAGPVNREVNQQTNGGQWNSLGEYQYEAGSDYKITITAVGSVASTCADAVKFVRRTQPETPTAEFSIDKQLGGAPLITQFTDLSVGAVANWYWSFGDGEVSTDRHPEHKYSAPGLYTVSLTVSNQAGEDTETKTGYVNIAGGNTENIYLCDAYSSGDYFMINMQNLFNDIGAERVNGVWVYNNNGVTYYLHHVKNPDAMKRAMKEDGSHIVFDGHSNFGLGATFASAAEIEAQQIDDIYFIDDDRITNYSTDMVSLKVDGMKYGQAYPNWNPVFKDGRSGIMPYTFAEGTPPYNYFLSYTVPGDPTTYKVELSDGRYLERFPDANTPAWFSSDGSPPDPVENPEYFITNTDTEFNHADFVGPWPLAKVPNAGYTGSAGYLGYNYQVMPAGNGANKATFTILIDYPGLYVVMASWFPSLENASNAKFVINHSAGSTTVTADQRTTNLTNPLGVYHFNKGAYTIELSDDANGNVIADAIILQYAEDPEGILQAEFDAEVRSGSSPLTVDFVDQSELYSGTDLELVITGWLWDFGDGSSSDIQNPSHTYAEPGVYDASLTVTDANGGQQTEVKRNFVTVGTTAPTSAEFTAESRIGAGRTVIKFRDQSSGNITAWLWDFGDGTTSTEQHPTHLYTEPGRAYTVSLSVTGAAGNATETEVDFVYNMVGVNYVDNTFHTKPHFYSGSLIRFGKVIIDTGEIKIPEEDLKYSRFFYGGCNSANYFVGTLHRGIMIFSVADVYDEFSSTLYLKNYLAGYSDQIIMYELLNSEPVWEYYNFNLKPPSMR